MCMCVSYCSRARATSMNPAAVVLFRSQVTLLSKTDREKILRSHFHTIFPYCLHLLLPFTTCPYPFSLAICHPFSSDLPPRKPLSSVLSFSPSHRSVVLICRALLSILAPMSSSPFPLRSTFLRQVLLPRAFTSTVPRERKRESPRDRDCRTYGDGGEIRKGIHTKKGLKFLKVKVEACCRNWAQERLSSRNNKA